jgi:hypothetical protein
MQLDVKFWKACVAYGFSLGVGWSFLGKMFREVELADLAVEYSANFGEQL